MPANRATPIYEALARALRRVAGICLHHGRVWNMVSTQPEDVDTLGENVCQPGGVMVLGTPIGHDQFTCDKLYARVEEERRLWEAIPIAPTPDRTTHCTLFHPPWQLRTATFTTKAPGPQFRDCRSEAEANDAKQVATIPVRVGGPGLRSVVRCADPACLAS